ncbi:MAG: hypothetical protein WCI23_10985, partial [Chlorobiaceae bacterium]
LYDQVLENKEGNIVVGLIEIPRGDISRISGMKERTARTLLATLTENGILGSKSPKGAVSLRFPVSVSELLFPNLFPAL